MISIIFHCLPKFFDYNQLRLENGSIIHSGDNKTREGEGDDEAILIDLTKISQDVKALVFSVTCYKSGDFSQVEKARVNVVDGQTGQPFVQISLGCQGNFVQI